jgi:4-oxalocrotonate tautomerase
VPPGFWLTHYEDTLMPHITVKLWPGKTAAQKQALADAIVRDAMQTLGASEESLSVAFEEVSPDDWAEAVYQPEIKDNWDRLYKKPGYSM